MGNSMSYGLQVKEAGTTHRRVWMAPGLRTTRLKIHASGWDTEAEAEKSAESLRAANPHLDVKVGKLR